MTGVNYIIQLADVQYRVIGYPAIMNASGSVFTQLPSSIIDNAWYVIISLPYDEASFPRYQFWLLWYRMHQRDLITKWVHMTLGQRIDMWYLLRILGISEWVYATEHAIFEGLASSFLPQLTDQKGFVDVIDAASKKPPPTHGLPTKKGWLVTTPPNTARLRTVFGVTPLDLTAIFSPSPVILRLPTGEGGFRVVKVPLIPDRPDGVTIGLVLQTIYDFYQTPLSPEELDAYREYLASGEGDDLAVYSDRIGELPTNAIGLNRAALLIDGKSLQEVDYMGDGEYSVAIYS